MSAKQKKIHLPVQWTISRWIWILTKIFYIVFQVLKVLLIKICKIQSLDLLFLVVFISFYISRYFSQVFRTSFNIIWKTDFHHKLYSLSPPTQTPPRHSHLLNSQNPLSVTNDFSQCSQTYHSFSRLLCYDGARKN